MSKSVDLAGRLVGCGHPAYIIAEIGINHNGSLETARRLIDVAVESGCDAVKFQKRDIQHCVPLEMKDTMRETPWGYCSYLEYRKRVEFSREEYEAIDRYCREKQIPWFASCWDLPSIDFLAHFEPPCIKIPSAALTDHRLLQAARDFGRPVILSTGMSTMEEIRAAVEWLGVDGLLLAHCTSTYPCPLEELNLRMINTLSREFACPVGYSGHETGLATTIVSVALGAAFVERHVTLDRAMWGSDQAASVEPGGLRRLVKDIRAVERALGDGVKRVYESEIVARNRLRLVSDPPR